MNLYCYGIPPIDFWDGALTAAQLLKSFLERNPDGWHGVALFCQRLAQLEAAAKPVFTELGWDGDIVAGPYYFALPSDAEMAIGLIVKQDGNGSCFVASPYPLPHLEGMAFSGPLVV